jgi:hypothetical protein
VYLRNGKMGLMRWFRVQLEATDQNALKTINVDDLKGFSSTAPK